jgi:hypothetical protein
MIYNNRVNHTVFIMRFNIKISGLLLIGTISFFFGCKKEANGENKITGTYAPATTMELVASPMIYTKNGQVTDSGVVNSFLNRWAISQYYNTTIVPYDAPVVTLQFLENNLLKVTKNALPGTSSVHAEIYQQTNSQLLIRQLDSLLLFYSSIDTCSYLSNLVDGFERISVCTSIPAGSYCKYRPEFIIKIENGQLYQYLITNTVKNTSKSLQFPGGPPPEDNYCLRTVFHSWDNFDPSIISRMGLRDTIVIQHKRVKLNKQ